jgi:HTH-type transcriptional regulator/antitoxin HigA
MVKKMYSYEPDYVVSPGEILEETLKASSIQKNDLAVRCGLSEKTISLILSGKAPVTPETAIQFERVLGISASIWNNLEAKYQLYKARRGDREQLATYEEWLKRFPTRELVQRDIIKRESNTAEMVAQLLDFFGVGSVPAWRKKYANVQASFRHSPSFQSKLESLAVWLREGELKAERIECAPFDKNKFDDALNEIRPLTRETPAVFAPRMVKLCADSGVAVVFVKELPGTHLYGTTRWLRPNKALIQLSLRYKSEDHFWFTFYHESGHILLHGKKNVFIDDTELAAYNEEEEQANKFAADRLIPKRAYLSFVADEVFNHESISVFAERVNIAPGILVGRLQYDKKISWGTPLNYLKRKFVFVQKKRSEI